MTGPPEPIDWPAIFRKLVHSRQRYRPWEIRRLTLPEMVLVLNDTDLDKPQAPAGGVPVGIPGGTEHYRRWLHGLTIQQRLELARDGQVTSEG